MIADELLQYVMPCGCVCYTCTGCPTGVIAFHAKELLRYLDGMKEFRENCSDYEAVVTAVGALQFWATQECPGCRIDGQNPCTYKNCQICACSKEHGADFCYLCEEYPCEKINKVDKWREANDYMLRHGAQAYFEKEKQLSHYRDYKK